MAQDGLRWPKIAPRAEGKAETESEYRGCAFCFALRCFELIWALACASVGSSRNYPGALLEASRASLGPVLDHLGSILGYFGPVFGHLGSILGDLSLVLDLSWAILGLSWTILGLSWAILALSWACLEPSWRPFGPSWRHLEPSWPRSRK